jgi:hypothetical protein
MGLCFFSALVSAAPSRRSPLFSRSVLTGTAAGALWLGGTTLSSAQAPIPVVGLDPATTATWLSSAALPAAEPPSPVLGVSLPDPHIPNYSFPEDEATVLGWVNGNPEQTGRIYLHGWGLWTSLTMPSGVPAFGLPNAPVYLTWISKEELVAFSQRGGARVARGATPRKLTLGTPRQLLKFGLGVRGKAGLSPKALTVAAGVITPDTSDLETVAYDPTAAAAILGGGLFRLSTLAALNTGHAAQIPVLPDTAVALKPVYKAITPANLINGRYYVMPAWTGTPPVTLEIQLNGYPEASWPGFIYVDTQNAGQSTSTGFDASGAGPAASPNAVYGLGDFVSVPINAGNRDQFEVLTGDKPLLAGDCLILMAMHVTTRETTEWTWQTFFWTPDPAQPPLPSGHEIAAARPSQLVGPASHYAASFAYQMVAPNQPINGGQSVGQPVVGFNPYLEAEFPRSIFGLTRSIIASDGSSFIGTTGVQSNCMTCHAAASVVFPGAASNAASYAADFYLSRDDPYFANTVQTDFLWSIADVISDLQSSQSTTVEK